MSGLFHDNGSRERYTRAGATSSYASTLLMREPVVAAY